MRPAEVFLSHASGDRRFVRRLARVLHDHGVRAFFSEHSIRAAQQWHDEIGAALARCDWFVVVLSPAAVASRWLKLELVYALQHAHYDGHIVPLFHRTCDPERISWTLGAFQYVDCRDGFAAGCRHLLSLWEIAYTPR